MNTLSDEQKLKFHLLIYKVFVFEVILFFYFVILTSVKLVEFPINVLHPLDRSPVHRRAIQHAPVSM